MKTHVSGQATVAAAAPTLHLGTTRRAILRLIVGSPLFSDAEQLRANHNTHECQDGAKLALWLRNVARVAAEREAADLARAEQGAEQPTTPAPASLAQRQAVAAVLAGPGFTQAQRTHYLGKLPHLTAADATSILAALAPAQATPAQADEVLALALHRTTTSHERTLALNSLPRLTGAGALALIGKLYAGVLHRTGQGVFSDGSTANRT